MKGKIISLSDTKTFDRFGKIGKVREGILKTDSEELDFVVWDDDVDKVVVGSDIELGGYVKLYKGKRQLNVKEIWEGDS